MQIPAITPKALLADKGCDGNPFHESLLLRGILPVPPPRSNRKVPEHLDYGRYRDRNRVELMFIELKHLRRMATRYYKTLLLFESFLNPAAARLWLKSYVNTGRDLWTYSFLILRTEGVNAFCWLVWLHGHKGCA
jgi:transposase